MSILKQTDNEIKKYLSNVKLSDICRTCLVSRPKMINVYSAITNEKYESSIINMTSILREILNATPVNQFPDKICSPCTRRLLRMHRMRQQCIRVDRLLRESPNLTCVKMENSDDEGNDVERTFGGEMIWENGMGDEIRNDLDRTSFSKADIRHESQTFNRATAVASTEKEGFELSNQGGAEIHSVHTEGTMKKKKAKKKNGSSEKGNSFICDECGKIFPSKRTLVLHVRTVHTASARPLRRTYVCATCNKQFTNGTSLRIHHKMHLGIKDVMCDVCGVRMRHGGALARHMRSHAAATTRHECSVCGRRYRSAQALKEHSTKHTGEKCATCTVCGLRVAHNGRLRWHMRRHNATSRVECDRCGRTFCSPAALRQHGLLHDNENAYCCTACGRKFSKEKHLIKHEQFHTGERPYICDICGHAFAHPKTLRNHKKTHNKTKHFDVTRAKEDIEKKMGNPTEETVLENEFVRSDFDRNV